MIVEAAQNLNGMGMLPPNRQWPSVYFDGGYSHASQIASWAFRHVSPDGEVVAELGGLLVPTLYRSRGSFTVEVWRGQGAVTNEHAESLALVRALEALPVGWTGNVCGDSTNTLQRIRGGGLSNKSPDDLRERFEAARRRVHTARLVIVDGHPTIAKVKARPELQHQVWCDSECNRLVAAALRRLRVRVGVPVHRSEEGHRYGRSLRRLRVMDEA